MRVKLQLVLCDDDGREETVTDVVILKKDHQRIEHLSLTLAEIDKETLSHISLLPFKHVVPNGTYFIEDV